MVTYSLHRLTVIFEIRGGSLYERYRSVFSCRAAKFQISGMRPYMGVLDEGYKGGVSDGHLN